MRRNQIEGAGDGVRMALLWATVGSEARQQTQGAIDTIDQIMTVAVHAAATAMSKDHRSVEFERLFSVRGLITDSQP